MQIRKSGCYKSCLVTIFIVFTFAMRVNAQTGIDTSLANALQHAIDTMLLQYNVKGISAAAYIPGAGMWKGVTGESYSGVPIDTTMLFGIGSITKTFVASEIFKLVEAGQLSLSDTVGALLPPMTYVNPKITVSQLLGHTSGMGEYLTNSWGSTMLTDPTVTWYFPSAFTAFCPVAIGGPGSPWRYCNSNYALLGMIIEAKKSDSLHHVLRNDFILPNNLSNTHMEVFEAYSNTIPHNWTTPTLNPALAADAYTTPHEALWSSVEPAGGYFSDAGNLAQWGYNLYSGKVLSPASLTSMLTCILAGGGYFNGYGLGVMRFVANGRTYYGHGGNYYGYASSMLYYPKDSLCVAVLINQDCIASYEARQLMDVLIKKIATGIREQQLQNNISVSPNPANNELIISAAGNTGKQIEVVDITGKSVYKINTQANAVTVNTAGFNAGEYFIRITNGDKTITKQVVIHH